MPNLLVVDDDPTLLYSLQAYLTRMGHTVQPAASAAEALEALVVGEPELIVSDILMEGMDGLEFQRRVQGLTGGRVPFIFLSAKGALGDRVAGLRAGADDYVVKPFAPEELDARIGAVLARASRGRPARAEVPGDPSHPPAEDAAAAAVAELDRLRAHATGAQREEVLESAERLEALVDDLSRAAEGAPALAPLAKTPQRIAPLVRAAAANAARLAAERSVGLQIVCGGLLSGNVDGPALQRALGALLEAVVSLAPPDGVVRLQAHRAPEGGLEIEITDATEPDVDRPAGHPPSARARWGAPSASALDLARRVARAHGGRLEVRAASPGPLGLLIGLPGRVARHVGKRG
jgi:DNA-binding response OmpR family regulator